MASSHLIRLGVIKGKNGVLESSKHCKRELPSAEHIDLTRTPLNYALAGNDTPANIATHAKIQMLKAGIETPRINAVMAVEVLFSLPIDRHQQDTRPFFTDCYEWTLKNFAGELLSFDVHLDESAPHAHAIILPLMNGKMQGNAMIGGTGNLIRLINLFHKEIACHYGLSKSDRTRLNASDKQSLEREVLTRLKADSVMKSSVWASVRDSIHKDPLPYAQLLSVSLSPAKPIKVKSFIGHKRSKGKGTFKT